MAKSKPSPPERPNNEIRQLILQYFYTRNKNSTSSMGKKGSAIKISNIKAELKALHGLTQQEVQSNLTYLISQGWIVEIPREKQVRAKGGTIIPSVTNFYQITAPGIDKIEGPGEFTMTKFQGINITATGQNIITLGDGNQVNAQYSDLGQALAELRKAITQSDESEDRKMSFVADIDTIESQLAKSEPNKGIISAAWDAVKAAASINGCATLFANVSSLIAGFLGAGS
jgi:type II secretory pathway component PulM